MKTSFSAVYLLCYFCLVCEVMCNLIALLNPDQFGTYDISHTWRNSMQKRTALVKVFLRLPSFLALEKTGMLFLFLNWEKQIRFSSKCFLQAFESLDLILSESSSVAWLTCTDRCPSAHGCYEGLRCLELLKVTGVTEAGGVTNHTPPCPDWLLLMDGCAQSQDKKRQTQLDLLTRSLGATLVYGEKWWRFKCCKTTLHP